MTRNLACIVAIALATGCSDDHLVRGTIYVEGRADFVVSGSDNVVYVKAGARIHNFGRNNRFVMTSRGDLNDEGTETPAIQTCDVLTYDASAMTTPGC